VTQESEPTDDQVPPGQTDGARVRIPPPLVYLAAVGLAVLLGWLWPRDPWFGGWLRWVLGAMSVASGLALIVTAMGRFKATGQDPKPWLPSPEMITTGPYQFTRNPMYLGLTMLVIGIGHLIGSSSRSCTKRPTSSTSSATPIASTRNACAAGSRAYGVTGVAGRPE
jgi:hypothetical protein